MRNSRDRSAMLQWTRTVVSVPISATVPANHAGNLREYRKKHIHVSLKALKKWSRQILKGLHYLHTREPCVIHRNLNCSNVFINGNIGQVKIGDLGSAALIGKNHSAHSLLGTPEFMAPELYEENYTEMIDIYAFGMCLLEMVTLELPYSECDNVIKIYKKVTTGVRPQAMDKVKDPDMKAIIEKCLAQPRARPSAADLLKDPFFDSIFDDDDDDKNIKRRLLKNFIWLPVLLVFTFFYPCFLLCH